MSTHIVNVTPPVGSIAGFCSPNPVQPKGRNALIQFQFVSPNTGWAFATPGFAIKPSTPAPGGMFGVTSNNATQIVVRDRNVDKARYSYQLMLTDPNGASVVIDPDIQNDSDSTEPA